jgi:hypothetical protein
MKRIFSLLVVIIAALASCKPRKAIEFRAAIQQKERAATAIIVGKGGPDDRKDSLLIIEDFKGALQATDEEEQALNNIIQEIKMLSTEGVKEGAQLKTAAINYYAALKALEAYDRKEIAQQEISIGDDKEKASAAQDSLMKLAVDKRKLYDEVYKKEAVLLKALQEFEKANGI